MTLLQILDRWLFAYLCRTGLVLRCSDAPDTSGINQAAVESSRLGREALTWFQQVYKDEAPARQATADRANRVSDAQLEGMRFATQQARDSDAYNKGTFRPLERQIVADAQGYDTAGRRADAAARAAAGVESAFGSAQDDLQRSLMRTEGAGPLGSGRSLALMQDAALAKAKARAGATSGAVQNVEQQGYARKLDAAGLGRGVVSNQATQQQIAQQGGNAAVGASNAALGATQSGTATMAQGFNTALAGQGQAGQLYGQAAGIEGQARGQDLGLLSSAFGSFMYSKPWSSKKLKTRHGEVDDAKVLHEIEQTPVEKWQYDPAKGGPDDGGQMHVGPMAERVHATMGDQVAPGGESIDLISMNGKLLAGMRALTKRVERIEKEGV